VASSWKLHFSRFVTDFSARCQKPKRLEPENPKPKVPHCPGVAVDQESKRIKENPGIHQTKSNIINIRRSQA
jgi:hypothetical protein